MRRSKKGKVLKKSIYWSGSVPKKNWVFQDSNLSKFISIVFQLEMNSCYRVFVKTDKPYTKTTFKNKFGKGYWKIARHVEKAWLLAQNSNVRVTGPFIYGTPMKEFPIYVKYSKESKLIKELQISLDILGYKLIPLPSPFNLRSIKCSIAEYSFDGLVHILPLRIDRYLPKENLAIEGDGLQHFKNVKKWGGADGLASRIYRDILKDRYCIEHKINLLRIPYDISPSTFLLSSIIKLCQEGKHVYASYQKYYNEIQKTCNMKGLYFIPIPIPN